MINAVINCSVLVVSLIWTSYWHWDGLLGRKRVLRFRNYCHVCVFIYLFIQVIRFSLYFIKLITKLHLVNYWCSYRAIIAWQWKFKAEITYSTGIWEIIWFWIYDTFKLRFFPFFYIFIYLFVFLYVDQCLERRRNGSSYCNRGLYGLLFILASCKELWNNISWTTEPDSTKLVCGFWKTHRT